MTAKSSNKICDAEILRQIRQCNMQRALWTRLARANPRDPSYQRKIAALDHRQRVLMAKRRVVRAVDVALADDVLTDADLAELLKALLPAA